MDTREYIEYLIQQQLNNNQQENPQNTLGYYKNQLNKVNKWGNNLSTTGDYLQGINNKFANKIGQGMSKVGNVLQNGTNTISSAPQNLFRGFAQQPNPAIENAISGALGNTATNMGVNAGLNAGTNAGMSAVGNAVADTAGSSLAGIGSTIGTEAGATAGGAVAGGASAGAGGTSGAMAGGPIGALVALGVMALQGTNRKRAKKSGEALLDQTNKMAKTVENDTTNEDFANKMIQQTQNNIAQGTMTGGASPIEPDILGLNEEMYNNGYTPEQRMSATSGLNGGDKTIASLIDKYNIPKPQAEAPIEAPVDTTDIQTGNVEKTKEGILSKLMSGLGDFAQGYKENRTTGFDPKNLVQDRFAEQTTTNAPSQQLIDFQNNLRNNEDFIKWANNAQKDKETVINNIANGQNGGYGAIDEWIKANPDALKPVANTQTTYTGKEKGKMARFGEGMGTITRALQNPTLQGLVAGGLGTALTGNPLYGLGLGYKFANQRAMSDIYRNVLGKYGIDIPETGTFGNVTDKDMKNIGSLAETHAWHEYLNKRNMDELARKIAHDQVLAEHYTNQDKARQQTADARKTSAQAQMIKANQPKGGSKGGSSKGGSAKTTKPQQNPDWNRDLADYYTLINNPKYATKIPQIKARFMAKYGEDPDKHLKD